MHCSQAHALYITCLCLHTAVGWNCSGIPFQSSIPHWKLPAWQLICQHGLWDCMDHIWSFIKAILTSFLFATSEIVGGVMEPSFLSRQSKTTPKRNTGLAAADMQWLPKPPCLLLTTMTALWYPPAPLLPLVPPRTAWVQSTHNHLSCL